MDSRLCKVVLEDYVSASRTCFRFFCIFALCDTGVNIHYLKAFDVFLMPSLYEGLPLSAVEAQTAGLPTLLSSSIGKETLCSDMARFVSLDQGASRWAKEALQAYKENRGHRTNCLNQVKSAGFDINDVTHALQDFYMNQSKKL